MSKLANWLPGVLATIEGFRRLEANWDSYGAEPLTPRAIEQAEAFVRCLATDLTVVPTNRGGVGFEWDACDVSLEVNIHPGGDIRVLIAKEPKR